MRITYNKKVAESIKGDIDLELPYYAKKVNISGFTSYYCVGIADGYIVIGKAWFAPKEAPGGAYSIISSDNSMWDDIMGELSTYEPIEAEVFHDVVNRLVSILAVTTA